MKYFYNIVIKPYILEQRYRTVCEIGAKSGGNTDQLLEIPSLVIDIIDPCIDADLCDKYRDHNRIHVHKGISLDVLQSISGPFDCVLIDGDHNWYTVYNELKVIRSRDLLTHGGTIFLHDVSWPYGKRDMYYQPELIPKEFTHPYRRQGIVRGQSKLGDSETYAEFFNVVYEGGKRNGVLNGIRDFLNESSSEYNFFYFHEQHGLGVLRKRTETVNILFLKHLLRAQYRSALPNLKELARYTFPALYCSLRERRDADRRRCGMS